MKIIHLIGAIALSITSVSCAPTKPSTPYTDVRDKKNYKTVKIGKQVWMAENLNYAAEGSLCYENQEINCQKYGRLYDWETAMKACPKGWHLPSGEEWYTLVDFAGGDNAVKALRASSGWDDYGINDFGFSALPGGWYYSDFDGVGNFGYWWTASEFQNYGAYYQGMNYSYEDIIDWRLNKSNLYSVRCVKD